MSDGLYFFIGPYAYEDFSLYGVGDKVLLFGDESGYNSNNTYQFEAEILNLKDPYLTIEILNKQASINVINETMNEYSIKKVPTREIYNVKPLVIHAIEKANH